jgi:ABC-2 type transport system ATP-binding protein
VLGKDIRDLSHGYRQRVGLGQALVHDPPILILDEPTSDLDPNEKSEVIRYIKEIGKERTILLSTHNLSEVEAACARAIIVSKGRVVADGPLDEIRSRSGKVRYVVTVHEQKVFEGGASYREGARKPPTAQEVQDALSSLPGVTSVTELPTDDKAHSFQMMGPLGSDIRAEIFGLIVEKGWLLLEMHRSSQTLEDVFKVLTKGDERKDRGRIRVEDDEDEDEVDEEEDDEAAEEEREAASTAEEGDGETEDEDEEDDEDEEEDDDEDEDEADEGEDEADEKAAPKKPEAKKKD